MGFALGFVLGYWLGTTPADERRARMEQAWSGVRDNPRVSRVAETVTRDARRLGDVVEQRLVHTADSAVDSIAGSVEHGDGAGSPATDAGTRPQGA